VHRLLRAIVGTAVEDSVIVKNPCVIKGAGIERPEERGVATVEQVFALADAIAAPFRAMVLTATFTGLRLGELRALSRRHVELLHGTVQCRCAASGAGERRDRHRTTEERRRAPDRGHPVGDRS